MAIRVFLISTLLFFNFAFCQAQTKSIEDSLRPFLVKVSEIEKESQGQLIIRNMLNYEEFDSAHEGIYMFTIFADHARPYLFFFENHQIKIIRNYSVSNVLKELSEFFERNDSTLDQKAKITYLENIVPVIKNNQFPPGWYELPPEFELPDSLKQ